ncbi:CBS domain-containing protein [Pedobacter xixiisoli]|uniref:CBS domain-containing protein n=1 Tax=Pedobacter xixiisoli TaxID=1476464 RepID=A0A285ZTY6_9SPHI|nr:CBS domain-containing protein [Pedobacter xixiisoli]SOD13088.1 CBS domain-containing protein [Pedobacter xixiisoli]
MKQRVPISEIMTKNLVIAHVTDSLKHISTLLKENNIKHLPVVSGRSLVGVISKTDILRLSFADIYEGQENVDETVFEMLRTEQVMVHNPTTVDVHDTVKEVADMMSKVEFHALPVLDEGKIVGIISTTDLIKYLLAQYHH